MQRRRLMAEISSFFIAFVYLFLKYKFIKSITVYNIFSATPIVISLIVHEFIIDEEKY